jgi:hypothetical protein
LRAINKIQNQEANLSYEELPEVKSAQHYLRYELLIILFQTKLSVIYEFSPGPASNKSIDFKVSTTKKTILFELTSAMESQW